MSDDLRERVASVVHAKGWPDPVTLPLRPDSCGGCEEALRITDAALAEVAAWLGEQVEVVARVLLAEGAAPGGDLGHSWRCQHPDRYGPCECVPEVSRAVLDALVALLRGEG